MRQTVAAHFSALWILVLAFGGTQAGCSQDANRTGLPPAEALEAVLSPAGMANMLRQAGGGHYHGSTAFDISPVAGGERDAVATTTDLWMDGTTNYRLVELNDRDGGREIILYGKELAVALRYGRLIRRPAQEPEVTRFLEEAMGGPWAAWEIARRHAQVEQKSENGYDVYRLTKATTVQPVKAGFEKSSPLRRWREGVDVQTLSAEIRVDPKTKLVLASRLAVTFTVPRDDGLLKGMIRVESWLRDRGTVAALPRPKAEELVPRQRTILEERALLGRSGTETTRARGTR